MALVKQKATSAAGMPVAKAKPSATTTVASKRATENVDL